ncbi:MAG: hypothetical protein KDB73_17220 [Planctomycetes bacterium]|nr:hypothetical protein [Planctomycetota bacterium]
MILAILLLLVGLAFIVAEVFFPSMGLLGLAAGAAILFGLVVGFEEGGQVVGWILIAAVAVAVPFTLRTAFRVLPRLGFGRRMILAGPATEPGPGLPDHRPLVGAKGVAESDLRPSGMARFGETRISVVAASGYLPRSSELVVLAVDGPEIRVDLAPTASVPSTNDTPEPETRS